MAQNRTVGLGSPNPAIPDPAKQKTNEYWARVQKDLDAQAKKLKFPNRKLTAGKPVRKGR